VKNCENTQTNEKENKMSKRIEAREVEKRIADFSEKLIFWQRVREEIENESPTTSASHDRDSSMSPRRMGRPTKDPKTEGWSEMLPKVLARGPLTIREIETQLDKEGYPVIYQTIYGALNRGITRGEVRKVGSKFVLRGQS
jgi:hypothetical protein